MARSFLDLSDEERREVLTTTAATLGIAAQVLEQDVWVCWTLNQLSAVPGLPPVVFKGGTSLSKVYDAIKRYSKDLDLTLDCRALVPPFDPFVPEASKTGTAKHTERLREATARVVSTVLLPALQEAARKCDPRFRVEVDGDEHILLHYPSVLPRIPTVEPCVKLEIGGRNSLAPNTVCEVRSTIEPLVSGLELPRASVPVLSPERTFWEKVTLLHAEVGRGELRPGSERLSRHWADVAALAEHPIGKRAMRDKALLADVVKYKRAFYPFKKAEYDLCLVGKFRLVPPEPMLAALEKDYQAMVDDHVLGPDPLTFRQVMDRVGRLQRTLNEPALGHGR